MSTSPTDMQHIRTRDALMRAFSVAERVTASMPEVPTNVEIRSDFAGSYTVEINFYRQPERVVAVAEQYGVEATVVLDHAKKAGATYTEAAFEVGGVSVKVWTLVFADVEAVAS